MPNYKATIKTNLPKDPPWRTKLETHTNEVKAESPEGLFRQTVMAMTERLRMDKDIGFFVGLMLNLINPFPLHVRQAIVAGVVQGLGFRLEADGDEVVGHLNPVFSVLPLGMPESEPTPQTQDGLTRLPSGLVIPS